MVCLSTCPQFRWFCGPQNQHCQNIAIELGSLILKSLVADPVLGACWDGRFQTFNDSCSRYKGLCPDTNGMSKGSNTSFPSPRYGYLVSSNIIKHANGKSSRIFPATCHDFPMIFPWRIHCYRIPGGQPRVRQVIRQIPRWAIRKGAQGATKEGCNLGQPT